MTGMWIIRTSETNRVTAKLARLIGFEPMPDGMFERDGDTGVRGIYRPLKAHNGYDGMCPVNFDPYKNADDTLMVAGYLNITLENVVVAGGKQMVKARNHEFESEAETVADSPYMMGHAKLARKAIMTIAEMHVKKHFDIDPSVTTTTTTTTKQAGV